MSLPLRWGILGTARIGRSFVRGVGQSATSCIQAVASREWTRAYEYAKENGIPRAFGCYDEMLRSGEIDLVYNSLPNSLHAEWTIRAVEAGLPVLCEKPFAANAAEAREVAAAAARAGKTVAEAFMYRYHPIYAQVIDLVRSGGIGALRTIHAVFNFMLDEDDAIIASPELAGGALMDVGCYCVSFCRLIADAEPLRVCALEDRKAVDESFVGILEFSRGRLATIECGIKNHEERCAQISNTEGIIHIGNPWYPGEDRGRFTLRQGNKEEVISVTGANLYQLEAEDFVQACRTHQPLRWPVQDAVANMTVIDALRVSAKKGKTVAL